MSDGTTPSVPAINLASNEFAAEMRNITARAKCCMMAAQQRQKRDYDENTTNASYTVGTKVPLSTANLALEVLKTGTCKVTPKWVGPFTNTERVGPMGYNLDLHASMKGHDVFHVCYLKPYRTDGRVQPPPLPDLIDDEPEFEVQEIVGHRHTKRGRQRKLEYLLRFTGYGAEHDMWQDDVSG